MKFRKVVHKLFWGISPKKWMSFDLLQSHGKMLSSLFHSVLSPAPPTVETAEDFQSAMRIAGINSADIKTMIARGWLNVKIFSFAAALAFLYACCLVHQAPFSSLLVFMLAFLSVAYAWREHFNLTKLRCKKLYLSISQWWSYLLRG